LFSYLFALNKTALLSYVKNFSRIIAADNIRINAISPGNVLFEGGIWEENLAKNRNKILGEIKKEVPMNTFLEPDDIARAAVYLVSDEARYVTGTNLIVDAGQTRKIL